LGKSVHLSRLGKKQNSGFGFPPIAATKIDNKKRKNVNRASNSSTSNQISSMACPQVLILTHARKRASRLFMVVWIRNVAISVLMFLEMQITVTDFRNPAEASGTMH